MSDVLQRCWLYSAHRQRCIRGALCLPPADCEGSEPVRGPLLFPAVVVVVVLADLGILRC